MPLLFSVGQHSALQTFPGPLQEGERMFALRDDIPLLCYKCYGATRASDCTVATHKPGMSQATDLPCAMSSNAWQHLAIPQICPQLGELTVLGPNFVAPYLDRTSREHHVLHRVPVISNRQCAWFLLSAIAPARVRIIRCRCSGQSVPRFARTHDSSLWECAVPNHLNRISCWADLGLRCARPPCKLAHDQGTSPFGGGLCGGPPAVHGQSPSLTSAFPSENGRHHKRIYASNVGGVGVRSSTPPLVIEPGSPRQDWQHEATSIFESHLVQWRLPRKDLENDGKRTICAWNVGIFSPRKKQSSKVSRAC